MNEKKADSIAADAVFTRRRDLVASEIDGETVMMSIENSKYYGIDAIGSRIWQLLAQPHSANSICEIMRREYEVPEADCLRDVLAFMNRLRQERLIESSDVGGG